MWKCHHIYHSCPFEEKYKMMLCSDQTRARWVNLIRAVVCVQSCAEVLTTG